MAVGLRGTPSEYTSDITSDFTISLLISLILRPATYRDAIRSPVPEILFFHLNHYETLIQSVRGYANLREKKTLIAKQVNVAHRLEANQILVLKHFSKISYF